MKFRISGNIYDISKDHILAVTRGIRPDIPDSRYKWYVQIRGEQYPIKQLISLATGLPNVTFNANPARRALEKLGFKIENYQNEEMPVTVDTVGNSFKFAVTLEKDEDSYFVASVPALPGCHTQGRSKEEAISNIKEAIRGYIASIRKHGEQIPSIEEVREVEVVA